MMPWICKLFGHKYMYKIRNNHLEVMRCSRCGYEVVIKRPTRKEKAKAAKWVK